MAARVAASSPSFSLKHPRRGPQARPVSLLLEHDPDPASTAGRPGPAAAAISSTAARQLGQENAVLRRAKRRSDRAGMPGVASCWLCLALCRRPLFLVVSGAARHRARQAFVLDEGAHGADGGVVLPLLLIFVSEIGTAHGDVFVAAEQVDWVGSGARRCRPGTLKGRRAHEASSWSFLSAPV